MSNIYLNIFVSIFDMLNIFYFINKCSNKIKYNKNVIFIENFMVKIKFKFYGKKRYKNES